MCLQSRNDHKTGVHFKNWNMSSIFYFSCHITVPICRKIEDKKIQIMTKMYKKMIQTDVNLLSNSRFRDIYTQNRKTEYV